MCDSLLAVRQIQQVLLHASQQCQQLSTQLAGVLEQRPGDLQSTAVGVPPFDSELLTAHDLESSNSPGRRRTEDSVVDPPINWPASVFGESLNNDPGSECDRRELLAGLMRGDLAALDLIGRLWIWRASRPESLPPLLKEVGESFYRWSVEAGHQVVALRGALITWLEQTAADAGLRHRIELANVGDRFDRGRHNAPEPGLELTAVHGWVVVRDNGSVYTKALVTAR